MGREIITSQQNKFVKHIKLLQQKKNRRIHKEYIVEGLRMIEECYKHRIPLEYILYSEDFTQVHGGKSLLEKIVKIYNCYEVSTEILAKLSDTENTQGILAVAKMRHLDLSSIPMRENAFFIVLDRIQDPGNMGTIIRTAEAAGVDAIILTKGCVDPYNTKTVRATMGALLHVPILEINQNEKWINHFKDNGVKLIAASLDTDNLYLDIDYSGKIAIIIGNEANGIDEELMKQVDVSVKLPILGKIESLNASIAAAILIYKSMEHKLFSNL